MRVVFPFHFPYGYARVLRPLSRKGDAFSLPQRRRLSFPSRSSLSHSDWSSFDGSANDSPSTHQSAAIAEGYIRVVGGRRESANSGFHARRKYSFTRRWYSKEEMLNRVAFVLQSRSWNLGFPDEPRIELNEFNVSFILSELFDASSDAALSFFFFRWSQRHNGSKHGIYPVCTMIHISVLGNMNHIALMLIRDTVRSTGGGGFHESLFLVVNETSKDRKALETVCSMLVRCYADEGMIDVALKLASRMKVLGAYPANGVLVTLVKKLLKLDYLESAFSIFAEALHLGRDLSKHILSLFIQHCCAQDNLGVAYELFSKMHLYGCRPDVISYTIIISALCKKGLLKEGIFLLYKLVQEGISPDAVLISAVVDGYCKAKGYIDAVEIMKAFNCAPDEFIYDSFICELCRQGNMVDATKLLFEMSQCGVFPDSYNWTTVVAGYCKANKIDQALKLFGGMLKRGLKPTIATCSVLIESYCKFDDVQEADNVFNKMRKCGLQPDLVAYNMLINGHGKQGRIHKTLELLDMMKMDGVSPDTVTYNILIHVLLKEGFLREAMYVLTDLDRTGFSPDKFTYTDMISGLFEKGYFQEAFHIWCYMNKTGGKPDAVSSTALINGLCKAQLLSEAHALFFKMLGSGLIPDVRLYNTLISGYCRVGDVHEACLLLNMMAETNVIPNDITYRAFTHGLQRKGVQNSMQVGAMKIQQILVKQQNVH